MSNYSKQREIIRHCLEGRVDHPTAEMIYTSARRELPNISLGTVYRNLKFLAAENELMTIECGDGVERYDPNPVPHIHFYCTSCGRVYDVPGALPYTNAELDAMMPGGSVDACSIVLRGVCADCAKRPRMKKIK